MRTVGVHCLESAGTGPAILKVVPVTYAALAGHHAPINAPFFSHAHYWYIMAMLKVSVSSVLVVFLNCDENSKAFLAVVKFPLNPLKKKRKQATNATLCSCSIP